MMDIKFDLAIAKPEARSAGEQGWLCPSYGEIQKTLLSLEIDGSFCVRTGGELRKCGISWNSIVLPWLVIS